MITATAHPAWPRCWLGLGENQQKSAFPRLLLRRTASTALQTWLPYPPNGSQGKSSLLKENVCRSYRCYGKFIEVYMKYTEVIFIGDIGHN